MIRTCLSWRTSRQRARRWRVLCLERRGTRRVALELVPVEWSTVIESMSGSSSERSDILSHRETCTKHCMTLPSNRSIPFREELVGASMFGTESCDWRRRRTQFMSIVFLVKREVPKIPNSHLETMRWVPALRPGTRRYQLLSPDLLRQRKRCPKKMTQI